MQFPRPLTLATLACLVLPASALMAQNEDATPDDPNADAAYLRIVMPVGETVRIDGQNLVSAPNSPASPYATVGANPEIIVSDVLAQVETPIGGHYSYLWAIGGNGQLVEDIMPSDSESVVRLYNLTPVDGLELWITGQEGASISGLGPIAGDSVLVEPGTISAELRAGGESIGMVEDLTVEAGTSVSVVVWGDPGSLGYDVFTDVYE